MNLNAWCNNILLDHTIFQSWLPLVENPWPTQGRYFTGFRSSWGKWSLLPLIFLFSSTQMVSSHRQEDKCWTASGHDPGPLGSLGGYSNNSFWGEKTDFPTFYNVQSYCLLAAMWYIQAPWAGLILFDCLVFHRVFYLEIMSLTIYYPKYHPRLWAEIQFSWLLYLSHSLVSKFNCSSFLLNYEASWFHVQCSFHHFYPHTYLIYTQ